jgi:hypothetical protein
MILLRPGTPADAPALVGIHRAALPRQARPGAEAAAWPETMQAVAPGGLHLACFRRSRDVPASRGAAVSGQKPGATPRPMRRGGEDMILAWAPPPPTPRKGESA